VTISHLWTYVFGRGFTGGPGLASDEHFSLDLDGIALEVSLPPSNVVVDDMSQRVNFPYRSQGWFEREQRQSSNHFYVSLLAHNWAYLGPHWKVMNEPFGIFSVEFRLKRTLPGYALSVDDFTTLEKAIHWEYEEYFEAKVPGQYFRGHNTEVRQKAEKEFAPRLHPTSRNLGVEKERYLQRWLRAVPKAFEVRAYNARSWVYYGVEHQQSYPERHYCHQLDERYYLDVLFHYGIDFRQYFHLWKDHAEAAEQRIMNSVRLIFPQSPPQSPPQLTSS
jgi:hypothetical protein